MAKNNKKRRRYRYSLVIIIQFPSGLVKVSQDVIAAVDSGQLLRSVAVHVDGVRIRAEVHEKRDAFFVPTRRCQVEGCVAEVVSFVGLASVLKHYN